MIDFRAASSNGGTGASVTVDRPAGVLDGDVLLAWVVASGYAAPTITAPAGWDQVLTRTVGSGYRVSLYRRRAASEPASYQWTSDADAGDYRHINVLVAAYSGCISTGLPIDVYSDVPYVVDNDTVRAASVNATRKAGVSVCLAAAMVTGSGSFSPPDGYTERVDRYQAAPSRRSTITIADQPLSALGATGDKNFTFSASQTVKHAVQVVLRPVPAPPERPVITAPARQALVVPGGKATLTAIGTDPTGWDVAYRWRWYCRGEEWLIGTSEYVDSGTEGETEWDTAYHQADDYELRCWTVDVEDQESLEYAARPVTVGYCVVIEPPDGTSRAAGVVVFEARGILDSPEPQVVIDLEIDTNDPPDPMSDDYQLLTSEPVDQDEIVGLTLVLDKATWYYRARAKEAE